MPENLSSQVPRDKNTPSLLPKQVGDIIEKIRTRFSHFLYEKIRKFYP